MNHILVTIFILTIGVGSKYNLNAQQPNHYWGDLYTSGGDFGQGRLFLGLSGNAAIDHHLISVNASGSLRPLEILCESAEPGVGFYTLQYGFIDRGAKGFKYIRSGLGLANYHYASDTIFGEGFFGCDKYRFSSSHHLTMPIEIGAGLSFRWFMCQVFGSVHFAEFTSPVYQAGIKLGFGSFKKNSDLGN